MTSPAVNKGSFSFQTVTSQSSFGANPYSDDNANNNTYNNTFNNTFNTTYTTYNDRMPEDPNKKIFSMRTVEQLQEDFFESRKMYPTHDDVQPATLQIMANLTRLQGVVDQALTSYPSSGTSSPRGRVQFAGVGGRVDRQASARRERGGAQDAMWRSPLQASLNLPPPALQARGGGPGNKMNTRLSRFERNRLGKLIADIVLDAATLCNVCNASLGEEENLLVPVSLETPKVEDTPFLEFDPPPDMMPGSVSLQALEPPTNDPHSSMNHRPGSAHQRSRHNSGARRARIHSGSVTDRLPPSGPEHLPRPTSHGPNSELPPWSTQSAEGHPGRLTGTERSSSTNGVATNDHSSGVHTSTSSTAGNPHTSRDRADSSHSKGSSTSRQGFGSSLNAKFVLSVSSVAQVHDSQELRKFFKLVMSLTQDKFTDQEFEEMGLRFCIPHLFPALSTPGSPRGNPPVAAAPNSAARALMEGTVELLPDGLQRNVTRSNLPYFQQLVTKKVIELEGEDYVKTISPSTSPTSSFKFQRTSVVTPPQEPGSCSVATWSARESPDKFTQYTSSMIVDSTDRDPRQPSM